MRVKGISNQNINQDIEVKEARVPVMKSTLDRETVVALEKLLRHRIIKINLFQLALTHTSARTRKLADYERLEFLGDRVLALIISEALLQQYPEEKEGDLAKRLAQLVRQETLADVARSLKLGNYIRLSRGENASGGRDNGSLLSDVCEALIAALYLDGGLEVARNFVIPNWMPRILATTEPPLDAKTELQEFVQKRGYHLPYYEVISQSGPSHNPVFVISVSVETFEKQTAQAHSKRQAEQLAAREMLDWIKKSRQNRKTGRKKANDNRA